MIPPPDFLTLKYNILIVFDHIDINIQDFA